MSTSLLSLSLTQGLLTVTSLLGWALLVAGAVILRARLGTPGSRWLLGSAGVMLAWLVVTDLLGLLGGLAGGYGFSLPPGFFLASGLVHAGLWLATSGAFFVAMQDLSRAWRAGAFAGAPSRAP